MISETINMSKTPIVSTNKKAVRIRNIILRSQLKKFVWECVYCGQVHTIEREELFKCFPLKKGYPATKCGRCRQYNYINIISNTDLGNQLTLKL